MRSPRVARRPARAIVATLASLLVLAGCGEEETSSTAWPAAEATVEARGLVWAAGSTIHLGDGSTLDAGGPIRSFVVAQGGAYVVPDTASDAQPWPELVRVTPDGSEPLGVHPEPDSLAVSPDGRHLAFLDRSGERDDHDVPVAEAVVVDLETGAEVHRGADGMGDPAVDDLTDLYEDATPYVLGVDDEHAWIQTVGDIRSVELATGEAEVVETDGGPVGEPWYDALDTGLVADSPDGSWTIDPREEEGGPRLVAADGTVVDTTITAADLGFSPLDPPDEIQWFLDSWVDATTAAGSAVARRSGEETRVLITCSVPDGRCTPVPGSEQGYALPSHGVAESVVVDAPLAEGP